MAKRHGVGCELECWAGGRHPAPLQRGPVAGAGTSSRGDWSAGPQRISASNYQYPIIRPALTAVSQLASDSAPATAS
jgi:hypothetical protein